MRYYMVYVRKNGVPYKRLISCVKSEEYGDVACKNVIRFLQLAMDDTGNYVLPEYCTIKAVDITPMLTDTYGVLEL